MLIIDFVANVIKTSKIKINEFVNGLETFIFFYLLRLHKLQDNSPPAYYQ